MIVTCRNCRLLLGFWLVLLAVGGCARGPETSLSGLNPFLWKQLADDRQLGPTPFERLQSLQNLADRADKIPPAEQAQITQRLNERFSSEPDPLYRAAITRALGAFSTPDAAIGLRSAVEDEDVDVRIAACEGWSRRGGPEAIHVLGGVLQNDEDPDVRLAAARSLGETGDPAAVPVVGVALDDADPALQLRAMKSLKKLSGQDLGNSVDSWRQYVQSGRPPAPDRPSLAERFRRVF